MNVRIAALAVVLAILLIPAGASAAPCTQPSDCGAAGGMGYAYCENGVLERNYLTWECISSKCSGSIGPGVVKACASGCTDDVRYADAPSCLEDIACPAVQAPVCGEDNKTYANECLLFVAGVRKGYEGVCRASNNPPEIIVPEGSLMPGVGDVNMEFGFRAIYRDPDGDPPEYVKLEIGEGRYYMRELRNETSGPRNGTEFYLSINLSAGSYSHRFIASDGIGKSETRLLEGPEVWSNRSIKNPVLSIINPIWSVGGLFSESALVFAFQDEINSFLRTCRFENGTCRVPLNFTSESGGRINISGLRVFLYNNVEGDTDSNHRVDIFDLARVGLLYGRTLDDGDYDPNADLNGDGAVNILDLATVGLNYGKRC